MHTQREWAVIQGSLLHKVAHLPRVAGRALVGEHVTDTADAVANATLAIGHCQVQPRSDEDKRARAQLELPMCHGAPTPVPCGGFRRVLVISRPCQCDTDRRPRAVLTL